MKQANNQRDRRLIEWMQNDFETGFTEVVKVYQKQLCSVAYNVLECTGLAHLTEDVVQESFIKAYNALGRSRTKDPLALTNMKLRAWLNTIVRHEAVSLLRKGDKTAELQDGQSYQWESSWDTESSYMIAIATIGPEDVVERRETIEEIRQLTRQTLDKLSPIQREVLERKYLFEGSTEPKKVTFEQIAKDMNVPIGTVKSAASRGSSEMKKILIDKWEKERYRKKESTENIHYQEPTSVWLLLAELEDALEHNLSSSLETKDRTEHNLLKVSA